MSILSEEIQKEILLAYERDYGHLVLEYNKLGGAKTSLIMKRIITQALNLRNEIIDYTEPQRNYFNIENTESALDIADAIQQFIYKNLQKNAA